MKLKYNLRQKSLNDFNILNVTLQLKHFQTELYNQHKCY